MICVIKNDNNVITLLSDNGQVYKVPCDEFLQVASSTLILGNYQGTAYPCIHINNQLHPHYYIINNKLMYCDDELNYRCSPKLAFTKKYSLYIVGNYFILVNGDSYSYVRTEFYITSHILFNADIFELKDGRVVFIVQGSCNIPSNHLDWVYNEIYVYDSKINLVYKTDESEFLTLSGEYKNIDTLDKSIQAIKVRIHNMEIKNKLLQFDFIQISDYIFSLGNLIIDFGGYKHE